MRVTAVLCGGAAALALALAAGPAVAAHEGGVEPPEGMAGKIELIKGKMGTRLIGHAVRSRDGEVLGELADLGIATGEENPVYAVISLGGVLGVGPRRVAVPLGELDLTHSGYVVFKGSPDSLKDRPLFRGSEGGS